MRKLLILICLFVSASALSSDKAQTPIEDNSLVIGNPSAYPYTKSAAQKNDAKHPVFIKLVPADDAERDKQDADARDKKKLKIDSAGERLNRWIAFFTGLIAIFTIGLYLTARQVMKTQLRAYVFLESITFDEVCGTPTTIEYIKPIIKWTNSGATPAKNVVACCNCDTFDDFLPSDFTFPDYPIKEFLDIGPNASLRSQYLNASLEGIKQVAKHEANMFVWGWVDYDDVFSKKRHRTEFCCQILVSPIIGSETGCLYSPIFFGRFNGSDDTCTRNPEPYKKT